MGAGAELMPFTITIAWVESEWVATEDPGTVRIDLGVRVKGKMQPKAHAVVWLLAGDDRDRANAEAWANKQAVPHSRGGPGRWYVATWPTDHSDPLAAAKAQAIDLTPPLAST